MWYWFDLEWNGSRHVYKVAEETKRKGRFPMLSTTVVLSQLTVCRDHTCRRGGPTQQNKTYCCLLQAYSVPLLTGHSGVIDEDHVSDYRSEGRLWKQSNVSFWKSFCKNAQNEILQLVQLHRRHSTLIQLIIKTQRMSQQVNISYYCVMVLNYLSYKLGKQN